MSQLARFIGDIIRELREDSDRLQRDLAKTFRITPHALSQYERNRRKPDIETVKKIAEEFNVSVDYLLNLTKVKYDTKDSNIQKLLEYYSLLDEKQKQDLINEIEPQLNQLREEND